MAELRDPHESCFVALLFGSSIMIAISILPLSRFAAEFLLLAALVGHLIFACWRSAALFRGEGQLAVITAAAYLPAVTGNFISSIALSTFGYRLFAVLLFGAGLFSWLAIAPVLLQRLCGTEPLKPQLRPTLGIRLSPPATGCLAYLSLEGGSPDIFAQSLIGYGLLECVTLLTLTSWITRSPFTMSYWAFSFGLTALALADMSMSAAGLGGPIFALQIPLFAMANLLCLYLFVRTCALLLNRKVSSITATELP
jgi:tellurite resistance protein